MCIKYTNVRKILETRLQATNSLTVYIAGNGWGYEDEEGSQAKFSTSTGLGMDKRAAYRGAKW